MKKDELLRTEVKHIDITVFDSGPLLDAYGKMSFQARNLSRAAKILETMMGDKECSTILCLAGSLFSAGLKDAVIELVERNMFDAVVSTGAIIVDQDFFEGLGFRHYQGTPRIDDEMLRQNSIDRIYDTYIDEDELRICDMTISELADSLEPRPYSSREFIMEMGRYLDKRGPKGTSLVHRCYLKGVPVFVPAFSDCSAGFGLVHHQYHRNGHPHVSIDSVKDFLELTRIKMEANETGLFMIGGGVPKNFAQDITVAAEILGIDAKMHKYAVQITVADERDGALSGSTLKEAHSWGKVDSDMEQMVFSEATVAVPLLASYLCHSDKCRGRKARRYNDLFQ